MKLGLRKPFVVFVNRAMTIGAEQYAILRLRFVSVLHRTDWDGVVAFDVLNSIYLREIEGTDEAAIAICTFGLFLDISNEGCTSFAFQVTSIRGGAFGEG